MAHSEYIGSWARGYVGHQHARLVTMQGKMRLQMVGKGSNIDSATRRRQERSYAVLVAVVRLVITLWAIDSSFWVLVFGVVIKYTSCQVQGRSLKWREIKVLPAALGPPKPHCTAC